MAEPKKRMTSTRTGNRRSHMAYKKKSLAVCEQCKEPKLSHEVCRFCGYYDGKEVIKVK